MVNFVKSLFGAVVNFVASNPEVSIAIYVATVAFFVL
jgi:hypothetical protein